MADITNADYMHAKIVCKDFEKKNLGEYHHLYLKIDTLLLANVFKNFRKMYLKIYHLDPLKILSAPGLAWQTVLTLKRLRGSIWACGFSKNVSSKKRVER